MWGQELQDPDEKAKAGLQLADGFGACLLLLIGDLDHVAKELGLEHSGSLRPCTQCRCNKSTIPWTETHATQAKFWATVYKTAADWRRHHPRPTCVLWELVGITGLSFFPDWMHTKHLGCDQYTLGSVLSYLFHEVLEDDAPANLQWLWACIRQQYQAPWRTHSHRSSMLRCARHMRRHAPAATRAPRRCQALKTPTRLNRLTENMIENKKGPFPSLKSKAAESRNLGQAVLNVFVDHMDEDSQVHRVIKATLEASVALEDMITEHMDLRKYPLPVATEFLQLCSDYDQRVTWLCNHFHPQEMRYFNYTFKFHQLLHCGYMARYLNPARTWCYQGEDLMQRVKKVVASSTRGVAKHMWCDRALQKYTRGWSFQVANTIA